MWEVPSGSAIAGEESLEAVVREAREETGITLLPENAELFSTYRRDERNSFYDNWLFRQCFDIDDAVLCEGETIDVRAATLSEISRMMARGEFIDRTVFSEFDLLKKLL